MAQDDVDGKIFWWEAQPVKGIIKAWTPLCFPDGNVMASTAVLLSSSPQANVWWNQESDFDLGVFSPIAMASSLVIVDRPPMDETHSPANRITFNAFAEFFESPWTGACSVVPVEVEGYNSCKQQKLTISVA